MLLLVQYILCAFQQWAYNNQTYNENCTESAPSSLVRNRHARTRINECVCVCLRRGVQCSLAYRQWAHMNIYFSRSEVPLFRRRCNRYAKANTLYFVFVDAACIWSQLEMKCVRHIMESWCCSFTRLHESGSILGSNKNMDIYRRASNAIYGRHSQGKWNTSKRNIIFSVYEPLFFPYIIEKYFLSFHSFSVWSVVIVCFLRTPTPPNKYSEQFLYFFLSYFQTSHHVCACVRNSFLCIIIWMEHSCVRLL